MMDLQAGSGSPSAPTGRFILFVVVQHFVLCLALAVLSSLS
jgi:hypothetical protein